MTPGSVIRAGGHVLGAIRYGAASFANPCPVGQLDAIGHQV